MKCWDKIGFEKITLYKAIESVFIDYEEIRKFLLSKTEKNVVLKDSPFSESEEEIVRDIARCRVRSIEERKFKDPLPAEIKVEKKINRGKDIVGVLYDGKKLANILRESILKNDLNEHVIIILNRLIGTIEQSENRYHARTVVCSIPSLISLSGIVKGPAKPKEYYLQGENEEILDFNPMKYGDERLTEALKSYALQTVFWRLTGEPFCKNKGCRLYNSHWQKEVIEYQIEGDLCDNHQNILEEYV